MRFTDDDLEVYLKLSGRGQDKLRYYEKEVRNIAGLSPRKKISQLFATDERFVVVIRFGKKFNLFSADAVKVTVKFGKGQSLHSLKDAEPIIISETLIRGQQHVVLSIKAGILEKDRAIVEDDERQWPLKMKACEGYINSGNTYKEGALPGTVTVFVARCKPRWADGTDTRFGETDPSRPRIAEYGEFEPFSGTNGMPYICEFRPSPVDSAHNRAAVPTSPAFIADPDPEFVLARTETESIRTELRNEWAERQETSQKSLALDDNGEGNGPLSLTTSSRPSQQRNAPTRSRVRKAQFCRCGNHTTPFPRPVSGESNRRSSLLSRGDNEGGATTRKRAAPPNIQLDSVQECSGCHGAKVPKRAEGRFGPQLVEWCARGKEDDLNSAAAGGHCDEDDEEVLSADAAQPKRDTDTAAENNASNSVEHAPSAKAVVSPRPAQESEADAAGPNSQADVIDRSVTFTPINSPSIRHTDGAGPATGDQPGHARPAEELGNETMASGVSQSELTDTQPEPSNDAGTRFSDGIVGKAHTSSRGQDTERPPVQLGSPPPTQPPPEQGTELQPEVICLDDDEETVVHTSAPSHSRSAARVTSTIKDEPFKQEDSAPQSPSVNVDAFRPNAEPLSGDAASSMKRAASTDLTSNHHKRRAEVVVIDDESNDDDEESRYENLAKEAEIAKRDAQAERREAQAEKKDAQAERKVLQAEKTEREMQKKLEAIRSRRAAGTPKKSIQAVKQED